MAYVKKVMNEMSKNHKETDHEIITGFMPQLLDLNGRPHKLCPVRSFENYLNHPDLPKLWQTPLKKFSCESEVWYKKVPLGHNTIEKFMSRLSKECNLTDHYTNHCIRVSGATNLTRSNYTAKQVMSVTGHKSRESLAIYQRVRSDDKLSMGISLTYSLMKPTEVSHLHEIINQERKALQNNSAHPMPDENVSPLPLPQPQAKPSIENHALDPLNENILPLDNALVPYKPPQDQQRSTEDDFDLMEILKDFQESDPTEQRMVVAASQVEAYISSTFTKTAIMSKNQNIP